MCQTISILSLSKMGDQYRETTEKQNPTYSNPKQTPWSKWSSTTNPFLILFYILSFLETSLLSLWRLEEAMTSTWQRSVTTTTAIVCLDNKVSLWGEHRRLSRTLFLSLNHITLHTSHRVVIESMVFCLNDTMCPWFFLGGRDNGPSQFIYSIAGYTFMHHALTVVTLEVPIWNGPRLARNTK